MPYYLIFTSSRLDIQIPRTLCLVPDCRKNSALVSLISSVHGRRYAYTSLRSSNGSLKKGKADGLREDAFRGLFCDTRNAREANTEAVETTLGTTGKVSSGLR